MTLVCWTEYYILRFNIIVDEFECMKNGEVLQELSFGIGLEFEGLAALHEELDAFGVADEVEAKSRLNGQTHLQR